MSDFGQPPGGQGGGFGQPPSGGGGGFGQPPGGGGFGQPPGGGGFGPPPGGAPPGGGGFGQPAGGGGFGEPGGGGFAPPPAGVGGEKTEVLSIVSLVTGLVGLLSCCCGLCISPVNIAAIVTGALALSKINKEPGLKGKELSYAGIGLGVLGILIGVGYLIYGLVSGGGATPELWDRF